MKPSAAKPMRLVESDGRSYGYWEPEPIVLVDENGEPHPVGHFVSKITNLNKNPEFENFDWVYPGWSDQDPTKITLDSFMRGPFGGNSLKIIASKARGGVELSGADTMVGKRYVTSFYMRTLASNGGPFVVENWGVGGAPGPGLTAIGEAVNGWQRYYVNGVSLINKIIIDVWGRQEGDTAWIANVQTELGDLPTPYRVGSNEPSTIVGGIDRSMLTWMAELPALAGRFRPASAILPVEPTVSVNLDWASDWTLPRKISGGGSEVSLLGSKLIWDSWRFRGNGAYYAPDVIHTGTAIEFLFTEQNANGSKFWIYVDGAPLTPTEEPGNPAGAGESIALKLTFDTYSRRRITVHTDSTNGFIGIATGINDTVIAAPALPRVAFVGDSFMDGSSSSPKLRALSFDLTRLLDVNGLQAGIGGTGYTSGGYDGLHQFDNDSRISELVAFNPELIVVVGSVNDDGNASVQSRATTYFAKLATSLPGVPVIVFGPQPSSAEGTLSTGRAANNAAVRAAAQSASNVLTFFDMLGTASGVVPPNYTSYSAWTKGQLTSYKGSVYEFIADAVDNMGPYTPDTDQHWGLRTYAYTGTGTVGSPAGDGSRDVLLSSDTVHPTVAGAMALADRIAREIRTCLETQ